MSEPRLFKTEKLGLPASRVMLHELAAGFVEETYARGKVVPPLWLLGCGTQVAWLETPWEDMRDKRASVELVRHLVEAMKVQAIAQISEAWVAALDMRDPQHARLMKQANKYGIGSLPPQYRDDVVYISSQDRAGDFGMSRYKVTDRKGKGPNFLGPRVDEEGLDHMEGPMFNMFTEAKEED